jgi:hypothetical protein
MECTGSLVCVDKVCIQPNWPAPTDYSYVHDEPGNWAEEWTNDLQGAAHSSSYWYFNNMQSIIKLPIGDDPAMYGGSREDRGPTFVASHFHYGDSSFYGPNVSRYVDPVGHAGLFVPIEIYADNPHVTYLSLHAPDLSTFWTHYMGTGYGNLSWCAVNPADGLLYVPKSWDVQQIDAYRIRWPAENGNVLGLDYVKTVTLRDGPGANPKTILRAQGGDFSQNGHLYIVSDECSGGSPSGGIYGFDTNGFLYEHIAVPYNYPGAGCKSLGTGDELEGIDIVDLDSLNPGLGGQIHVMKVDNHASDDAWYFQHIKVKPAAKGRL